MKKRFLTGLVSFLCTSVVLLGLVYAYAGAKQGVTKYKDVKNTKKDVEYTPAPPEDMGISIEMPKGERIVFLLDFADKEIRVKSFESEDVFQKDESGISVKYSAEISYELFGDIIDRVGGVNFSENEKTVRLTGAMAAEKMQNGKTDKKALLSAALTGISTNGIGKDDFIYLLENCESTNLSLLDMLCYSDYITEMVDNIKITT